jgi:hypothetical protein
MRKKTPWIAALVALPLFVALVLPLPQLAWAHGGCSKPEYQFDIYPKKIEDPNRVIVKMGDIQVTAGEFFSYVRNIAGFKIKADMLQRNFLLHFWVVEAASRYYPSDINDYIPRMLRLEKGSEEYQARLNEWVLAQAGLYARFLHYTNIGKAEGRDKEPHFKAVLDVFGQQLKADYLEDVVKYGKMDPTQMGVRKFVAALAKSDRQQMEKHYTNPDAVKPFERRNAEKRWVGYRRDLMGATSTDLIFKKVKSLAAPDTTPIAKVNQHVITLGGFKAIYGPMPNDTNWNNLKNSRGSKLMLYYGMGDEAEHLGIVPPTVREKIDVSQKLYLAAEQLVRRFGAQALDVKDPTIDFGFYRKVVYFQTLLGFVKVFWDESAKLPEYQNIWIDKDYLAGVDWFVEQRKFDKNAQPTYF